MKENSNSSFSKIGIIFIICISIYYAFKVTNFKKEIRSINETNIISKDTVPELNDESTYYNGADTMATEYFGDKIEEPINFISKKYNFESKNYIIDISGEIGVGGESFLNVFKNGKIILKEDFYLWMGNIQDFKIENRFCYFAIPIAGGTDNKFYIHYYCFDFKYDKIYKIEYNCNFTYDYCDFENLATIENNEEIYNFMKANMRVPVNDDNYFILSE